MNNKVMLIDGNSIINRAFFALPVFTNKAGEYTNAVYGFLNILFKFFDEDAPGCIMAAFDLPFPTFRHKMYGEYKGSRKSMPEELRPQLPLLKNLLRKMRIGVYELPGYEADDIIGAIAARAKEQNLSVIIVSGDRDLLQLAGDDCLIRIPKHKSGKTEVENYYAKDVYDAYGVTPREYIEVKALMGDASDEIPGVPGIGEKTALKIIAEYKDVENAVLNAADIKPKKASENLVNYADLARLSRRLSEIVTDAPVDVSFDALAAVDIFNAEAFEEIKRLEFKSFLPRFNTQTVSPAAAGTNIVADAKTAGEYIRSLINDSCAAFYTVAIDGQFFGISFYNENGAAFMKTSDGFGAADIIKVCEPFFNAGTPKLTLDYKREIILLSKYGVKLNAVVFDATLAGYVLNPLKNSYNYDDIAFEWLGETYQSLDELKGKGRNKRSAEQFSDSEIVSYAVNNAATVYKSYPVMDKRITENDQRYLCYDVELRLAEVLADMELTGIRVDRAALDEFGRLLGEEIERLTDAIYKSAGEEFNINSTNQLGAVLFDKLRLTGSKRTKTGYSTDAEVLEKLRNDHPIIPLIQDYRTYTKLKSTYADGLAAVISDETGKIHSSFNQTVTATGRISSTEPNLQNIPVRLPLGRNLRKAFIPTDDSFVFVDGDYSQIELRVLAHMSGDETLINAFIEGQDIHRLTASQVFNATYGDVTIEQRGAAKAVNFGIVYGISAFSLSEDIGVTKKEAENYIDGYFKKYPNVKKFLDASIQNAVKTGYAQTITGRRRAVPELVDTNFFKRSFGERVAMNTPVQGSAADIIKIAMVNVYKRFKEDGLASRIVLQVHDELLVEAKKDELETVKAILKEEMEHCVNLKVPLETELKTGGSWYETK